MDSISSREFHEICHCSDTKILRHSGQAPKICEKNENSIIKIFYRKKKWVSSDKFKPRALRFIKNSHALSQKGFTVPEVTHSQYCKELKIHLVYYKKIPGENIRSLVQRGQVNLLHDVAKLLADLHCSGIFFRAIHLENLIYQPDGNIALIDVSDVRFKKKRLSLPICYRNLKHIFLIAEDKKTWLTFGIRRFLNHYFQFAYHSSWAQKILMKLLSEGERSEGSPS